MWVVGEVEDVRINIEIVDKVNLWLCLHLRLPKRVQVLAVRERRRGRGNLVARLGFLFLVSTWGGVDRREHVQHAVEAVLDGPLG